MNASKKWGKQAELDGLTFWVRMTDEEALLLRGALSVCLNEETSGMSTLEEKMAAIEFNERVNHVVVEGRKGSAKRCTK